MQQIENNHIIIKIAHIGAELQSLVSKNTGLEYMWSGDPAFWPKYSPVLFPIVGALKENRFLYKDHFYTLPRHGCAREKTFVIEDLKENSVRFLLKSDEETRVSYPFDFDFSISYTLIGDRLIVQYSVVNTGRGEMLFSVGGHPAFQVPLEKGLGYEDYYLEFSQAENAARWPIAEGGLLKTNAESFLVNQNRIGLSKELFAKDAIVLKHLNSDRVSLRSDQSDHGLEFHFGEFPFLGIWAAPNADFVCIEPWQGIADSEKSNQKISEKEGIRRLEEGERFDAEWWVRCF